jgi:hypothetical protein
MTFIVTGGGEGLGEGVGEELPPPPHRIDTKAAEMRIAIPCQRMLFLAIKPAPNAMEAVPAWLPYH